VVLNLNAFIFLHLNNTSCDILEAQPIRIGLELAGRSEPYSRIREDSERCPLGRRMVPEILSPYERRRLMVCVVLLVRPSKFEPSMGVVFV
jgi:hypothetical protein